MAVRLRGVARQAVLVGEWGIAPGSEFNDHGENPQFIGWMPDWRSERADDLAYEAFFNMCLPGQ